MPKVLRIINRFNLGGPTLNAAYLTKYLEPEYQNLLIGGQWDEHEESSFPILEEMGIKPVIIPEMKRDINLAEDRKAYLRIKKIINDFKPDIIHTHASKAGAIGRLAAINYGKAKIVHTFHGHVFHSYFGSIKTGVYKNIERSLAAKTHKIIAISERQKLELYKKYRICEESKIVVIPLGFDLDKFQENRESKRESFRSTYHVEKGEVAIGIIGRLVPIKNHRLFLKAIRNSIDQTDIPIRAFIIGDGEERESLKRYSMELGLDYLNGENSLRKKASVHFTSWIKDIDVANAGLDIVALTSFNEGTPVSLIEAQASNKPIVSTKVGGVGNTIKMNETALLSASNDVKALTDNLIRLIKDQDLRTKMGEYGWKHVQEKFHYSRLVKDTKNLYDSLLE